MKEDNIPKFPCHVEELNLHCFGCCGNNFGTKEELENDIIENTNEFKTLGNKPNKKDLEDFRDRFDADVLPKSGVCFNLVNFGEECFGCPLHKHIKEILPKKTKLKIENDEELRYNHCDVNYECETYKYWKFMSNSQKKDFVKWVKDNNYDWYKYSFDNGEDLMMKKFLSDTKHIITK